VQIGDRVREGDPLLTLDCPDAAEMRAAVESAPASLRDAHSALDRERLPIPAFSAGTQMTHEVTGTSTFFGFSMPLPLFDRNQGAIAKATAQIRADDLALEAELAEARADIERATTVLAKRREALTELEGRVVQRVPMLRRMSEDAYREGGADILELLDAMRSVKDIEIADVQQLESATLAEEVVVAAAALDVGPP
jgi:cobalt-zinc-cadmium efflux system outer membrane protein